jgi:hypothetical protein
MLHRFPVSSKERLELLPSTDKSQVNEGTGILLVLFVSQSLIKYPLRQKADNFKRQSKFYVSFKVFQHRKLELLIGRVY